MSPVLLSELYYSYLEAMATLIEDAKPGRPKKSNSCFGSLKATPRIRGRISFSQKKGSQSVLCPRKLHMSHVSIVPKYRPKTYEAMRADGSVFDPEAMCTHQIRHHHVSKEAIADNSNLRWRRHAGLRDIAKVLENFRAASRFLEEKRLGQIHRLTQK